MRWRSVLTSQQKCEDGKPVPAAGEGGETIGAGKRRNSEIESGEKATEGSNGWYSVLAATGQPDRFE